MKDAERLSPSERTEAESNLGKRLDDNLLENVFEKTRQQINEHSESSQEGEENRNELKQGEIQSHNEPVLAHLLAPRGAYQEITVLADQNSTPVDALAKFTAKELHPPRDTSQPEIIDSDSHRVSTTDTPSTVSRTENVLEDKGASSSVVPPDENRKASSHLKNRRRRIAHSKRDKRHSPMGASFDASEELLIASKQYPKFYYENRPLMWGGFRDNLGQKFYTIPTSHYETLNHFAVNDHAHRYDRLFPPPIGNFPQLSTTNTRRKNRNNKVISSKKRNVDVFKPVATPNNIAEQHDESLNKLKMLNALTNFAAKLFRNTDDTNHGNYTKHSTTSQFKTQSKEKSHDVPKAAVTFVTENASANGQTVAVEPISIRPVRENVLTYLSDEEHNDTDARELGDVTIITEDMVPWVAQLSERDVGSLSAMMGPEAFNTSLDKGESGVVDYMGSSVRNADATTLNPPSMNEHRGSEDSGLEDLLIITEDHVPAVETLTKQNAQQSKDYEHGGPEDANSTLDPGAPATSADNGPVQTGFSVRHVETLAKMNAQQSKAMPSSEPFLVSPSLSTVDVQSEIELLRKQLALCLASCKNRI